MAPVVPQHPQGVVLAVLPLDRVISVMPQNLVERNGRMCVLTVHQRGLMRGKVVMLCLGRGRHCPLLVM